MQATIDKYQMSTSESAELIKNAREGRHDVQLSGRGAAHKYLYADMQLDALIAAHDLVELRPFKGRFDAQNARGDDVTGWLAKQHYSAENGFQRIEPEINRRRSPPLLTMIDALRGSTSECQKHVRCSPVLVNP